VKSRESNKRLSAERRARLMGEARGFRVNMARKKWCDLWHMHLDWNGEGKASVHIHREFIRAHFVAFRNARRELVRHGTPYQLFLAIYPSDPESDALYVHTENPQTPFPHDFGEVAEVTTIPWLLRHFVDPAVHQLLFKDDPYQPGYIVQYK
jgi:hypothetical protein